MLKLWGRGCDTEEDTSAFSGKRATYDQLADADRGNSHKLRELLVFLDLTVVLCVIEGLTGVRNWDEVVMLVE